VGPSRDEYHECSALVNELIHSWVSKLSLQCVCYKSQLGSASHGMPLPRLDPASDVQQTPAPCSWTS
jgi:hypothetical protein